MENIASSQTRLASTQKASRKETIQSLASSIVINAVLPFLIYWALKKYTSTSDFLALVASGVPSLIDSIIGVIRRKRIDLLSGIVLSGIAISLITIALGGSPKVYLIRESFFTAAFGLVYLVSLLFPRPLAFYFSRYFATGNHPENISWFNSLWQRPQFRHVMRVITVVWGIGFLLEAAIRTYLVIVLSTEQFLIISPFVFYGILGALMVWMFLYSRKGRKKAEEMRQRMEAEQQATPSQNAS
jgi:hypothetical protein